MISNNALPKKQINMSPMKKVHNKLLVKEKEIENDKLKGYLVNLNWINLWKKYTNYYKIIEENMHPLIENYEGIAEKLYFYQKNNKENIELPEIELIYFDSNIKII